MYINNIVNIDGMDLIYRKKSFSLISCIKQLQLFRSNISTWIVMQVHADEIKQRKKVKVICQRLLTDIKTKEHSQHHCLLTFIDL